MRKGFMYLTAIIDVHSSLIVGRGLHSTLNASNCIEVLEWAISMYSAPEIINSDQGYQFTSKEWDNACAAWSEIKVSMDGRGRAKDCTTSCRVAHGSSKNIWIGRFWKTIKYEYIYIQLEDTGSELYYGIMAFVDDYNYHRRHQGINHMVPSKIYLKEVA